MSNADFQSTEPALLEDDIILLLHSHDISYNNNNDTGGLNNDTSDHF